jgi:hypothetical protein
MTLHSNCPKTTKRFGLAAPCPLLHGCLARCSSATTPPPSLGPSPSWCGIDPQPHRATASEKPRRVSEDVPTTKLSAHALEPPAPGWRVPGKTCAARNLVHTVDTFNHGSPRGGRRRRCGNRQAHGWRGSDPVPRRWQWVVSGPGVGVATVAATDCFANCTNQMEDNVVTASGLSPNSWSSSGSVRARQPILGALLTQLANTGGDRSNKAKHQSHTWDR